MNKRILFLFIVSFLAYTVIAQTTVRGKVTDVEGQSIPGVNILVKGTSNGTVTDANGNYELKEVSPDDVLVFSFVGMLTEEITAGNQTVIDMKLAEDILDIEGIVVIGYGTTTKRDLTGSVSSVKADEIIKSPTFNPLEAIQGKVSGVDITRSSGAAGSGVDIVVRGNRSLGDQDDPEAFEKLNAPLYVIDGILGGSIADLNANDIESIEVLKDASTTAIYGYQGANGVIIITTKSAKAGKIKVSYNGYYGINGLTPYPEGRLKQEYIDFRRDAYKSVGQWSSPADDPAIFSNEWDAMQEGRWVNWTDLLLDNGSIQNHQLSASGGNEKTTTYFSLGYYKEIGPVKDDFARYNARLNINHTLNKWIKTGIQAQLTYTDQNRRKDAFGKANQATPLGTPYDENGEIVIYPIAGNESFLSPLTDYRPNAAVDNEVATKVFSKAYLEVTPLKGLSYTTNLGFNVDFRRRGVFNDSASMSQINTKYNAASIYNGNSKYLNWDNIITYTKEISKHSFTITALTSYTWNVSDWSNASGTGQQLTSQLFYKLDASEVQSMKISSGYTKSETFSYAGRLNYSYRGRYLLTATYRRDGSSRLAPGHQWASFPSVALAWRLSDEGFMKNLQWLTNMKLRASYGVAGISTIPPYGTQSSVVPSNNMSFGEVPAPAYSYGELLSSYELTWERSTTIDFGLDLAFFRNRLSAVVDIYNTKNKGSLFKRQLPVSAGGMVSGNTTFSIWQNIGKTENNGIEIELNSVNVNSRNFKWTSSLTFARNKEKITGLITDEDIISATDPETKSLLIGHPIQSFYTYKKLGIWQLADSAKLAIYTDFEPGEIKLADLNNDSVIDATNDRTYIGSRVPDWTLGFQNTFTYKGIDLSIYILARWGQMIENELLARYNPSGTGNGPAYIDYWTPENPTNDFPQPKPGLNLNEYTGFQTLYLVDGSYVKLKNVTLGYTLPQKICSKIFIENLRIYATASNLFIITKSHLVKYYDPENKGSEKAPMSKQIVFGINVDF
ncbi:MAG: TonB-dependent receptor [Bacteroidales bacterium]|nr:TonB-dependent receptor [Bacteroidales bacterium]